MSLITEINIKVTGDYLRGTIKNDKYLTNNLILPPSMERNKPEFGLNVMQIRNIIKELEELADLMDSSNIANTLKNN
ncbi:gp52 [Bacillus phage G]|uniref:Gp52 n=1 Tax=Bacillus phage G TaxID=2884420 RepID=G3MBC2_9CAUD|nr:gp52 [Bacillus phage G]AEO93323.1 gp52 [Bacillus phage G]